MGDNRILQGTTPYLACHFNPDKLNVANIVALELAFQQIQTYCPMLLIKGKDDCTIDTENNTILYHFTQDETLKMKVDKPLKFQFRFLIEGEFVGTHAKEIRVEELLSHKVFEL